MKKKNNFTLIELLVVVAIIGILVSILYPALAKARRKAVMVLCTSQIRQLSIGQLLYCNNFGGYFPDTKGDGYSTHSWGWAGNSDRWNVYRATNRPVNPFLTSDLTDDVKMNFLECPSDENPDAFNKYGDGKYSWYRVYGTSYSINKGPKKNSLGNIGSEAPQTVLQVREPSRMVLGLENHAVNVFQGLPESDGREWNINKSHNIGKKKYTNMIRVDLSALINKRIYRREELGDNWFDKSFTIENDR